MNVYAVAILGALAIAVLIIGGTPAAAVVIVLAVGKAARPGRPVPIAPTPQKAISKKATKPR